MAVVDAWRLEFRQPPGRRDWVGPFSSAELTPRAEELVRHLEGELLGARPAPAEGFAVPDVAAGTESPVVCGCADREALARWFGDYLEPLRQEGGHVARYAVRPGGLLAAGPDELLFRRDGADLVERRGDPPSAATVRSSAGARSALLAAPNSPYRFTGRRTQRCLDLLAGR